MNSLSAASTERSSGRVLLFIFCAFLLVGLHAVIDPRAMDVSLIPRLLALQIFLLLCVSYVAWSGVAGRIDLGVLRDPLLLCYAGYTLVTILSLSYATNPTAGFTDAAKTSAVLLLVVLACLLLPVLHDWPELLMKCATAAAALGLVAGLLDWPWAQGWLFHSRAAMETVLGLMSNVNLYASYLLLVLPLSAAGAFVLRGWWRGVAVAVSVVVLLMLLLLQTRAVYLGLSAAALVAALLLIRLRSRPDVAFSGGRDLLFALVLFLVAASAFLWLAPRELPAVQRLHSMVQEPRLTAAGGRPAIWLSSWAMFRDQPLQGVGAGNFLVRLHEYFDFDDPEFSTIHPNWLQPHNDFLWVMAEKGLLGFVFYLGLFLAAFWHLRLALSHGLPRQKMWLALFASAGLAGYLVVSFFDFPLERISHQVYLGFYFALSVLLGREARGAEVVHPGPAGVRAIRWVAAGLIGVLIVGLFYASAALRQERVVLLAREASVQEDWQSSVFYAERAATAWKTLDPLATPVSYLQGLGHLMLAKHGEALTCFERARQEMPSRAYIVNSMGLVHQLMGNYEASIASYEEVLRRSPGNPEVLHALARSHLLAKDPARALELLQQIPAERWKKDYDIAKARARKMMEGNP